MDEVMPAFGEALDSLHERGLGKLEPSVHRYRRRIVKPFEPIEQSELNQAA